MTCPLSGETLLLPSQLVAHWDLEQGLPTPNALAGNMCASLDFVCGLLSQGLIDCAGWTRGQSSQGCSPQASQDLKMGPGLAREHPAQPRALSLSLAGVYLNTFP